MRPDSFFDAIRIPETNAYVINILRAVPAVSEPPADKPSPEEDGKEGEEEEEEEVEETAAGAHLDGTREMLQSSEYLQPTFDPSL